MLKASYSYHPKRVR